MNRQRIALNRIISPGISLEEYLRFAGANGFGAVEVRNDLPGNKIFDGLTPAVVREMALKYNVEITTINALQRFNDRKSTIPARVEELSQLIRQAKEVGVKAIVLCPVNDTQENRNETECIQDTIRALKAYGSLFDDSGIKGFIEPLGFAQCSLRYKQSAVTAIEESGFTQCYMMVHDTFHHYLSGEEDIFPEKTGLLHISGVLPGKEKGDIGDGDRILVTKQDIMDTKGQITRFIDDGYEGLISFEPFSIKEQTLDLKKLAEELTASIDYLFT